MKSAAGAIDIVSQPRTEANPHLPAALKNYAYEVAESLRQVEDLLRKAGTSLDELFDEYPEWKDLRGLRTLLAHHLLQIDSRRLMKEVGESFPKLLDFLSRISVQHEIFVDTANWVIPTERLLGASTDYEPNVVFIFEDGRDNAISKIVAAKLDITGPSSFRIRASHPGFALTRIVGYKSSPRS